MKDSGKTKKELIAELNEAREKIKALEMQIDKAHAPINIQSNSLLSDEKKIFDEINQILSEDIDLHKVIENLMHKLREIFKTDRAWLLRPGPLSSDPFVVPIESTAEEYPGVGSDGDELVHIEPLIKMFKMALQTKAPLAYGKNHEIRVVESLQEKYQIKAQLVIAIFPFNSSPWLLGMHQCSYERHWLDDEMNLFSRIGKRIAYGLSTLLSILELEQSQQRYKKLSELTFEGIMLHNYGVVIDANESMSRITGYSRQELIGANIIELSVAPESRATVIENVKNRVQGAYNIYAIRKDGVKSVFEVESRNMDEFDPGYRVTAVRDITERKKKEDELKENVERYRTFIEHAPSGIFVTDLTGRFLFVNSFACELSGYYKYELLNMTIADLSPDYIGQFLNQEIDNLLNAGRYSTEALMIKKDATETWVEIKGAVLQNNKLMAMATDISEKIYARNKEKILKERLAMAKEAGGIGVWDYDIRNNYLLWDKDMLRLFGIEAQDFDNTFAAWQKCLHPDDYESATDAVNNAIANHEIIDFSFRIIRKDGAIRHIKAHGKTFYDQNGEPFRMTGVNYDISDAILTEQFLKKNIAYLEKMEKFDNILRSNIEYDSLLQNAIDYVYSIFDVSRAFLIYPCDPTADAWEIKIITHSTDVESLAVGDKIPIQQGDSNYMAKLLELREPKYYDAASKEDIPEEHKEFGIRAQLTMAIRPRIGKAWMIGMHECKRDRIWTADEIDLFRSISNKFEEALNNILFYNKLKDSEFKFRQMAELLPGLVYECNSQGLLTFASNQAYDTFGYIHEDLNETTHILQFMHPKDHDRAMTNFGTVVSGNNHSDEYIAVKKDGTSFPVLIYAAPIFKEQDVTGMRGFIVDITERKRVEKELRQLNENLEDRVMQRTTELEQLNKELNDFAYIVSHDLKAPLRGISRLASWLREDYSDKVDETGQEQFEMLIESTKRMSDMIDGILKYSRVSRIEDDIQAIDIGEIINNIIDMFAVPNNISIQISKPMPVVNGSMVRLNQILQNLISNAIKAVGQGQGVIKIKAKDKANKWQFSVEDNGCGIEEKFHDTIFQIFQTGPAESNKENTGIGLTLVKKLVEQSGGRIWLESFPGQGTKFFFTLPK